MRALFKSLLIALGLWIILAIFGGIFNNPWGWNWIIILPALSVLIILGALIGWIIERIKGKKSKEKWYVLIGLICAVIALLFALTLPYQNSYLIFGNPNPYYWPMGAFIIGALITFIIEKLRNK